MKNVFRLTSMMIICLVLFGLSLNSRLLGDTEKVIEKTFQVKSGGLLFIDSDLGSIHVAAQGDNQVYIKVYLTADVFSGREAERIFEDFNLNFDQSGNDVRVIGKFSQERTGLWGRKNRHLRVKYEITIPTRYNVDLNTSGGSISIDDLEGEVKSTTSGGSLHFGNIRGPVKGHTSGGSINLDSCVGNTDVTTSGGSITIGLVDGSVNARTSGGSVNITQAKGNVVAKTSGGSVHVKEVMGDIDAGTSGGTVTAHITRQPKGRCSLTSSGGSIMVYLSEGIGVKVDAETSGGSVHTDFPVTIQGKLKKSSLMAEINGGGPELYLRTSGGNIHIQKH